MKEEKNKLLVASILMIMSIIISIFYNKNNLFVLNSSNVINMIGYLFGIIGTIYFIKLYNSKIDLSDKKASILFFSIVFFVNNIISGIIGFIVYGKLKKEIRKLPELEDVKIFNKYICLFGLIICLFLLFFVSDILKGIYGNIIIYITILLIMIILFRKRLIRDFRVFKQYFKEYNSLVFKTWGKSLLTTLILTLTINLLTNLETSTNQLNLLKVFDKYPLVISLSAIIYAPIAEELMFRGVIKEFIKNKWAFILISGFSFGLVHVIDDFQTIRELLYILVYGSMGCYLAALYYKTNNICTNMYFHFLQNTLSIIGMIILKFM